MSNDRSTRTALLKRLLAERILVLDGAMGTSIQALDLGPGDFGGPDLEGCNENLVLTRPDVIRGVHERFLAAGADILETDTFGSTPLVLAEYGLQDKTHEINVAAAGIARAAADAYSTPEKPRFVAGSMGPTTKTIAVTGGVTWDELAEHYRRQALGLIAGGVDCLLLETTQDTLNLKAGLIGVDRAQAELGTELPIAVSCSIEVMGTLLAGQDIESFYVSLAHRDLLWIGLNCATGPDFMTDHLRTLAAISRFPVACVPNAGLPDENGKYNETPAMVAEKVGRFVAQGWVNLVGGCCGTVPEHIRRLAEGAAGKAPRALSGVRRSVVSGIETLVIDDDTRPVIVGERTNVLGSRKFKELIAAGRIEEASEIGRAQVRRGAHVLDVCLQDPDRPEVEDMTRFLEMVVKKVKVPIMLDSTDANVLHESLKRTQGKSLINSINLEDGEERFQKVVPLARTFGAALVVGCIDEDKAQAQAVTRVRKLAIAERSHEILTKTYGVEPEDIIFDALVFPVGTGDQNYVGSGVETIEGIRLIKQKLPRCKTILGVSNVSFGLPAAGREVLNSVFLYHCVQAGLDMAIVNSEKLERYAEIPEEERRLAEDLIWARGEDPIAAFAAHFRDRKSKQSVEDWKALPLDERLARYILVGSKEGLYADLDEALRERKPLAIINGPLMAGMDEVGRLFNRNELIVAEVLQSAEAMKAAVAHLEPHMEKSESSTKGTIVLATVKGDVHDIGKNLVEIILGNNGYRVVNLGIKVPPEELVRAYRAHAPDAIGLSGLLVKSAQMMVVTAQDLKTAGVACPILVGGAALTNKFTRTRIAPEYEGLVVYAKDAMNGLDLANQLQDEGKRADLSARLAKEAAALVGGGGAAAAPIEPGRTFAKAKLRHDFPIPQPPDLKLHVLEDYDLDAIFPYINPVMLYTRHLGFKGRFADALAAGDPKARELRAQVERVEDEMLRRDDIRASAVYKFFRAYGDGESLVVTCPEGDHVKERFAFGRQAKDGGLCLADFTAARDSGRVDYVAMLATTIGPGVRALADAWKAAGDYLKSHILQVLALEGAEAFAELLHQKIREMWGFTDPAGITKQELFKAHYRGVRVSFGYPACPRLEDQEPLFRLLDVEKSIGVHLTDGFMMEPEGSVTALVFHHPEARYFGLTEQDAEQLERAVRAGEGAVGA
ncbi:MAG: methionine synthase [Deltaproteobacteria bacterium]|nr:methionine synthase [Deltaproteobacteria bacterium]